jgi:hypothetical protein
MKLTKTVKKEGREIRKSNRGGEFDQSTLDGYMEISQ